MKVYKYKWPGVDKSGNSMPGPIGETYLWLVDMPTPPVEPTCRAHSAKTLENAEQVAMVPLDDGTWAFEGGGIRRNGMPYKYQEWTAVAAYRRFHTSGQQVRDVWMVLAECSCGSTLHFTASRWKLRKATRCRRCAIKRNLKQNAVIAKNPSSGEYLTKPGSVKNG